MAGVTREREGDCSDCKLEDSFKECSLFLLYLQEAVIDCLDLGFLGPPQPIDRSVADEESHSFPIDPFCPLPPDTHPP